MDTLSIDRFRPAIDQFSLFVKKGFVAKALVALVFIGMMVICTFGYVFNSDFIVAVTLACAILLAFLFYLLNTYIQESTITKALSTKERIEEIIAPDDLDAGEVGELFSRLALSIRPIPSHFFHSPQWLSLLITPCNRLISYIAWKPLHTLSEVFFLAAIDQYIGRIKTAPTNLQYHASLANCYVMLANHYLEPIKTQPHMTWPGIFLSQQTRSVLETKGRASSTSAIEELSILSSFAPDQLWVHDQLAISYRELEMPEREIEECEIIIALCPDDHQALLRLGTLYFRQGKNAKGLEVYESLKPIQPQLAEELIGHYGAYAPLLKQGQR